MTSPASTDDLERTQWPVEGTADAADPQTSAVLKPSERLGRYVVLYRLGVGGMGVVYAAYDPKLDRKVALKLMRRVSPDPARQQRAKARLLEEARAMAKLTHPNVLTVHDVGEYEGRVFMAMELVEGSTVTDALSRGEMSWREVLRIMIPAGRGLAAAHQAGLVHRDFKPDNVMLAKDGRVLVMDFGLARALDPDDSSDSLPGEGREGSTRRRLAAVVGTHRVGTPAYMAPEQRAGEALDGRSDQFSFCVTLHEALYGQRPFQGEDSDEIGRAVLEGRVVDPPSHSRVPSWLRAAVLKGLSVDPGARYPSMDDLLLALSNDPAIRRRRYATAAGLVVVVGVGVVGTYALAATRSPVCDGGGDRLVGVWEDDTKQRVEQAFMASDKPYAADVWRAVETSLDGYVERWSQMHREACEATRVRGEQSDELLDLRMECLGRRLSELRALSELFVDADADVVREGVAATGKLVPISVCADAQLLRTPLQPPDDPQTRARIDAVRDEIARAKAHEDAGRLTAGLAIADASVERARQIGHDPLLAEALVRQGELRFATGNPQGAQAALREGTEVAARGRHDGLAARAWIMMVVVTANGLAQTEVAQGLTAAAVAAVERAGGMPDQRAALATAEGALAHIMGRPTDAKLRFERALEANREAFGEDHPQMAKAYNNLAVAELAVGELQAAFEHLEVARTVHERFLGPEHPQVAVLLGNIGAVQAERHQIEEALTTLQRAVHIWERVSGTDHPDLGRSLINLAQTRVMAKDYARALEDASRAREMLARSLGKHPDLARALEVIGQAEQRLGRPEKAIAAQREALEIWRSVVGEDHPDLAGPLVGLGRSHLDVGEHEAAAEVLERALSIREVHPGAPRNLPEVRFLLARALQGEDPTRARELAQRAREGFAALPPDDPSAIGLGEVEAWLAQRAK